MTHKSVSLYPLLIKSMYIYTYKCYLHITCKSKENISKLNFTNIDMQLT